MSVREQLLAPDAEWREWPVNQKLRLRWRLSTDWCEEEPRPEQLTPTEHVLCTVTREECERLHQESVKIRDPLDRLDWMRERGHIDWLIWLLLTGRGWGKTRVGAEDIVDFGRRHSRSRLALVASTLDDVRKTMVEGESGILSVVHPLELQGGSVDKGWNRTTCEMWLANGTKLQGFSAEKPNRLRGPQHHRAWCDELAAWENMQDTWDNLMFGLRLGTLPQCVITTTPKPKKLIIDVKDRATTVVTTGHTLDNARNLAPAALAELKRKYEGTRLGAQELAGNLLEELEGALWSRDMIDADRIGGFSTRVAAETWFKEELLQHMRRVVVGVDPAITSHEDSDETGIIIAGVSYTTCPFCTLDVKGGHAFVIADRTVRARPRAWAWKVRGGFNEFKADRVVAESNQGGEMVEETIIAVDAGIPVKLVHAKRGKMLRAQPISAVYEQHKVHHVGTFGDLEDQMCTWEPDSGDDSPDRMDALVYALAELMIGFPATTTGRTHNTAQDQGR